MRIFQRTSSSWKAAFLFSSGDGSTCRFTLQDDTLQCLVPRCKYRDVVRHLGTRRGLVKAIPHLHTFVKSYHLANLRTNFSGQPSWNFEILFHRSNTGHPHPQRAYLVLLGGFYLMVTKHSGYINYLMRCLWVLRFAL